MKTTANEILGRLENGETQATVRLIVDDQPAEIIVFDSFELDDETEHFKLEGKTEHGSKFITTDPNQVFGVI